MLLNRRHLRIKVLQELYAYYQSEESDYVARERELDKSIEKVYEQYIIWLSLFHEIKFVAEKKIEENKTKKLPTKDDLNPNLKFVNNKVLELLSVNKELNRKIEECKISWQEHQDVIKKIFKEIRQMPEYDSYMNSGKSNLEEDKKFIVTAFKKVIANSEMMHHILEERSIFWVDDIDLVCSMVIKTIKQIDEKADEFFPILGLYKDEEDEIEFYKVLFRKTILTDDESSKIIRSKTDNWELDRIAKMDVILMKMAITEAKEFKTIPLKVSLNEYIEISKFYSTPKSNGFINGILDRVFEELKSNGAIKKVGRGLIE